MADKKEKIKSSVNKLPVICPPDKSGRSKTLIIIGFICRMLVIFTAVFGLTMFICDAFNMGETAVSLQQAGVTVFKAEEQAPTGDIAIGCLFIVLSLSLLFYGRFCSLAGGLMLTGYVVFRFITDSGYLDFIIKSALTLFNSVLIRLSGNNYHKVLVDSLMVDVDYSAGHAIAGCKTAGLLIFAFLIALIFVPCFIRRAHLIAPTIVGTILLVLIFTLNLSRGTLGISIVIAAFSAIIVMSAYDDVFNLRKKSSKYDNQLSMFGDDRPKLPDDVAAAEEEKKNAALRRKELKRKKHERRKTGESATVAEEIDDYFGNTGKQVKKAKTAAKNLSPQQIKEEKAAKRNKHRQIALVRKYDRTTHALRSASGGIAGGIMILFASLVIFIPALTVSSRLEIPWLSEKFDYAREFVTAILQGNDMTLDALDYEKNNNSKEPHDATATDRNYDGTQMMYIETNSANAPIYLRNWIGSVYNNGAWYMTDGTQDKSGNITDALTEYQNTFDYDEFPDESQKIDFFRYMYPTEMSDIVTDPTDGLPMDFTKKVRTKTAYGFIATLISVRRMNLRSSLAYLPSYFDTEKGLLKYGTQDASDMSFINYFDGIYTGRSFSKNHTSDSATTYASVTFTPSMKNANWIKNLSSGIASYNPQKEALLLDNYSGVNLSAEFIVNGKTDLLTATYTYAGTHTEWSSVHHCDLSVTAPGTHPTVSTDGLSIVMGENNTCTVTITEPSGEILTFKAVLSTSDTQTDSHTGITEYKVKLKNISSVSLSNASTDEGKEPDLLTQYLERLTDGDRDDINSRSHLMNSVKNSLTYSDFAYKYYTGKSDSKIISGIANDIITKYDINTTVAVARNSSISETYEERNKLVRQVIDYIIDKENGLGCKYTIDITTESLVDPALDGVENFLTVTKEGYCVQFASAAALILREYGIPVRYSEGYIASIFNQTRDENAALYRSYVHDYEAHAWIDVWFDGIGWVQYETTPDYYVSMYGASQTVSDNNVTVIEDLTNKNNEVTTDAETTDPNATEDTLSKEEKDRLQREEDERIARETLLRNSFIGLAVIAFMFVIFIVIRHFASKAADAEHERRNIAETILSEHYGENTNDSDRRDMALLMIDSSVSLLKIYGCTPYTGEFGGEYAKHMSSELEDILGHAPEYDEDNPDDGSEKPVYKQISDIRLAEVMEAFSAEEFGHGMSAAQMKLVARFYLKLRSGVRKRVGLLRRISLHFFKRKI